MNFLHKKDKLMNELIQLRKRNEELELKLMENESKIKLINSYSVDNMEIRMKNEKIYETLCDNNDDGFEIIELLYDKFGKIYDYCFLKVNKAWEKHVGLIASDVLGKRASEIFHTDSSFWLEKYDEVSKIGLSRRYEKYSEETKRWLDCLCIPISEKIVAVLFRDITEKKESEKSLEDSEQLYRTLFEKTEDAFHIARLIYDEDGQPIDYKFVKLNEIWEKQTGLNAIDALGKRVTQIMPNIEPYWIEMYDTILKSGKSVHYENYNEGTKKWYSMVGFPYAKDQVGILFRDISKQREYENKLTLQAEILANVQDAVIVTDENNIITYCNKAFINLFCWEQHELIGQSSYDFFNNFIDKDSKHKFKEIFFNIEKFPDIFHITEAKCYCKNGKSVIIDLNVSKLKGMDGDYKGLITSIRDVSQRIENLTKLQQSKKSSQELIEKLKRIDENKNEFLNIFSHEIRNPMAAAMMSVSLLNSASLNSMQKIKAKETLNRQLRHLSSLVDDLLDVTRLKTNKVRLKKEILDINKIIENAVLDHKANFDEREIRLEFELSPIPLYVEADNVRIIQVLDNLLNNSIKFTNKGDITIIKVQKDENKSQIIITIKDSGIGIPTNLQPDLFDPFIQVDNSLDHSNGGLGLGLAIVKGMVELHGGSVDVYSEGVGLGTLFTIRLPLFTDSFEKKDNVTSQDANTSKSLEVLVIDDNKDLTEIMRDILNILGYKTESALNGKDGLIKANQLHPDVIICDIGLPEMNGYEVAKSIRADSNLNDIYLIALSGYAQQEDIERSIKSGFNKHLAKPLSIDALKTTLDDYEKKI